MHYFFKIVSAAGLRVVKVFFVGAATIVADLVTPTARHHLLLKGFLLTCIFTRVLAVAPLVGAPFRIFVDQDSFD